MFSVIMPTYNCGKYVKEAIESVLAQTYPCFELIIVDDGSTDGTYNICLKLAQKDSRISAFQIEHDGVSAARNYGIERATGEYILFIDGDDTWDSELLKCCYDSIENSCEMLIFGIRADFYNDDDTLNHINSEFGNTSHITRFTVDANFETLFSLCNMLSPCNKVYSRALLNEEQIRFCENSVYLEDLKFNCDYLRYIDKLTILQKDLYHYRNFIQINQMRKRNFKKLFANADELYCSGVALLKSQNIALKDSKIIKSILVSAYIKEFFSCTNSITSKERKNKYNVLLDNLNFRKLIKNSREKFFICYKILFFLKLKNMQMALLKHRYWRY